MVGGLHLTLREGITVTPQSSGNMQRTEGLWSGRGRPACLSPGPPAPSRAALQRRPRALGSLLPSPSQTFPLEVHSAEMQLLAKSFKACPDKSVPVPLILERHPFPRGPSLRRSGSPRCAVARPRGWSLCPSCWDALPSSSNSEAGRSLPHSAPPTLPLSPLAGSWSVPTP